MPCTAISAAQASLSQRRALNKAVSEPLQAKVVSDGVLQVQWFERRSSVPPGVGALMSEAEVVESDLRCTNLVGCIDSKAVIVRADSYTQVCTELPGHAEKHCICCSNSRW